MILLSITAHLDDREYSSYGLMKALGKIADIKHSLVFCKGRLMADSAVRTKAHTIASSVLGVNDHLLGNVDLRLHLLEVYEISDIIYKKLQEIQPDVILIPSEQDLHQDHKLLSMSAKISIQRYIRDVQKNVKIVEVLTPSIFSSDDFYTLELNDETLDEKVQALKLFTTEKLSGDHKHEHFKVYSNPIHRINKKNVFNETSLLNFIRD